MTEISHNIYTILYVPNQSPKDTYTIIYYIFVTGTFDVILFSFVLLVDLQKFHKMAFFWTVLTSLLVCFYGLNIF
jgi:hypothetical protein